MQRWFKYGLAVVLVASAFLFRQWFSGQFGSRATYLFLYPAVLISAVLGGSLPGLLATLVAVLLTVIWILPPTGLPWFLSTGDLFELGVFAVMGVLISLLTDLYHRSQNRIQDLEKAQATRESEERFHTLADNIAQLAWMADPSGTRFWFNQRWLDYTGSTLEQMLDQDWQAVHHPDHLQRVLEKINHCFATGKIWEDTFPLRGKDGSYRWFLSRAVPIRNVRGEVERWFGTNTDVTELREAETALRAAKEAAEDANRAKDEFLAIISHELRTPMTVILGALQHLRESAPAPEQRQRLLEMADSSAHRLLGIINDLLDITSIAQRKLKLDAKPFGLRETVRKAVEMLEPAAREQGLQLQWTVAPEVPAQAVGDPDRLGQVLTNLLDNAVKFTEQGMIALSLTSAAEELAFTVRDTGIGISAGQLERIFDPFNQGDSSLTRRYGGTGLGLAICRELVTLMGGEIRVESEVGRGSVFSFTLPLRPASAPAIPPESVVGRSGGTGRILLADDEPTVRELVDMVLCQSGWEVIVVENGREAVECWQRGGIDLVLMDIQMPVLDGLEATRQIRRLEQGREPRTPVFALTAHALPERHQEFLAAGMDGVLTKPFRIEELDALIHRAAGERSGSGGKFDI